MLVGTVSDPSRLSLDGSLQGMYFFGYGDFLSPRGTGVMLIHHLLGQIWAIRGEADPASPEATKSEYVRPKGTRSRTRSIVAPENSCLTVQTGQTAGSV
jgi:hypothetical protein